MSSALTQPDEIQLGPLDLDVLADIAAGLACSVIPDGQDGFEGIEPQGGDLRRFARLLHTPAYEAWLIAWGRRPISSCTTTAAPRVPFTWWRGPWWRRTRTLRTLHPSGRSRSAPVRAVR
jgi:hypothetical protein